MALDFERHTSASCHCKRLIYTYVISCHISTSKFLARSLLSCRVVGKKGKQLEAIMSYCTSKIKKKMKKSKTNNTNKMHPDAMMFTLEQDLIFEFPNTSR